ncbi:hypothetical protein J1N35_034279 [Gossypium stocksii]|uniref:Uncharacterized protein n=1 Tax=Gossypium stocksii TaxID=47602 RepID=A0A9D3ZPX8_9ROSI|nr:hypothetical protein J1N35_034279 [Gossypium stocksii]
MACKIAYFHPHGQSQGCLSQPCVTHGQVTPLCVPYSFHRVASQAVTRPSTRPGTRACEVNSKGTWLSIQACGLAV